ncbi:hypothetical protein ACFLXU_01360 [Chloroflexota bacterium]
MGIQEGDYWDPLWAEMIEEWAELWCAWEELREIDSILTQDLEDREDVITIMWSPFSNVGSITLGDRRAGEQSIYMDSSLKTGNRDNLVSHLAHEAYHAKEGHQWNSIREEMKAYQYQALISMHPKLNPTYELQSFINPFMSWDPEYPTHQPAARVYLTDNTKGFTSYVYGHIPRNPPIISTRMTDLIVFAINLLSKPK